MSVLSVLSCPLTLSHPPTSDDVSGINVRRAWQEFTNLTSVEPWEIWKPTYLGWDIGPHG